MSLRTTIIVDWSDHSSSAPQLAAASLLVVVTGLWKQRMQARRLGYTTGAISAYGRLWWGWSL